MTDDEISTTVNLLAALHRKNEFFIRMQSRIDRATESHIAGEVFHYSSALSKDERYKIWRRVKTFMRECRRGTVAEHFDYVDIVQKSDWSRAIFDELRHRCERNMENFARSLPAYGFVAGVRGFGALSFARIIAEAGDLSNYSSAAKLWKRMGLAAGQNRVPFGLPREERNAAWIERGYNPKRRAMMWVIGDVLVKANGDGPYRALYLRRKDYEHARNPQMTKLHAHRRAQRVMEKRLLRDLWRAWQRTKLAAAESPDGTRVPAFMPMAATQMRDGAFINDNAG
jgi:hypothetical protein